jgi:hypothetical protein
VSLTFGLCSSVALVIFILIFVELCKLKIRNRSLRSPCAINNNTPQAQASNQDGLVSYNEAICTITTNEIDSTVNNYNKDDRLPSYESFKMKHIV